MTDLYGSLGMEPTDNTYINKIGHDVIYEAIDRNFQLHAEIINAAMLAFVEEDTEVFKEKYKSEGGGYMQRMSDRSRSATVKPVGGWEVAYPLEPFGDEFAIPKKKMDYMTLREMNKFVNTIVRREYNTRRLEMLRALFRNTTREYEDEYQEAGALTIQPLANGDSVKYPPKVTSSESATDNHYLVTQYAASAISDTNNPLVTARRQLEDHFGQVSGFGNCVTWINSVQSAKIAALADFTPIVDNKIMPGQDTDIPMWDADMPVPPGRLIGRASGVFVFEWDLGIPANYTLTIDMDAARPLKRRVHPEAVGLPVGLNLTTVNDNDPLAGAAYSSDYGFGCGDRRAAVVTFIDAGSSYTIPALYNY